jgi:hypothetical protein
MPSENGVWRDDRGNPRERATSEAPADHGETAPFIIAQAQPSTVQLHREHAILFAQKLNHVALLSIKPPEQRRKEQVKWNHARSLRQSRSRQFSDTTRFIARRPTAIAQLGTTVAELSQRPRQTYEFAG